MPFRAIFTIYQKELMDVLRDRRTIFAMIVLPIIVYPVLILFIGQVTAVQVQKMAEAEYKVGIIGEKSSPTLLEELRSVEGISLLTLMEKPEEAIQTQKVEVVVEIPEGLEANLKNPNRVKAEVKLYADRSRDQAEFALRKVQASIEGLNQEIVENRLKQGGLGKEILTGIEYTVHNLAPPKKMAGKVSGTFLPYVLAIFLFMGAMYPAIDLTAGEKERGTMETLLMVPVKRSHIVLGKFFTVMTISFIAGLANLLSIGFSFHRLLLGSGELAEQFQRFITVKLLLVMVVYLIPLIALYAALALVASTYARDFREAQNYITPIVFLVIFPAFMSFIPGIRITPMLSIFPVVNFVLLSKEAMMGNFPLQENLLTFAFNIFYAFLLLRVIYRMFESEEVLLRTSEETTVNWKALFRPAVWSEYPALGQAIILFFLTSALTVYLGIPLQKGEILIGLLVTEFLLIFLPTFLYIRLAGIRWTTTIPFRLPDFPISMATVFIGVSAWAVGYALFFLQNQILPAPGPYIQFFESLQKLLNENVVLGILVIAVAPGICEEILFRGFIQAAFIQRFGALWGILFTGLLFGFFHLDIYRLLPTAVLGWVFGWLVYQSGTILVSIFAHILHNATAVFILQKFPEWTGAEQVTFPIFSPSVLTAFVLFLLSVLFLATSRRKKSTNSSV